MTIRERPSLTGERAALLVRVLQLLMIAILVTGLWVGNLGVVVNATLGLLVSQLPALFKRRYGFTMNVGLVLWITVPTVLHALGTVPLPGLGFLSPYQAVWWWDHLTHALSSSLVAGAGYATARALDVHTDAVTLPPKFLFVYLLVFMMAFGIVWELVEFYVTIVAQLLGVPGILTQYGLEDTVLDLAYDLLGALLVSVLGTAYLTDVSNQLADRLGTRGA